MAPPPAALLPRLSLLALWRARRTALVATRARAASSAAAPVADEAPPPASPPPAALAPGALLPSLSIARLGADGKGVALLPPTNYVVLVDWALPGEVVDAKITAVRKGFAEAVRERTVSPPPPLSSSSAPSPFLHPPPCPDWAGGLLLPPRPVAGGCGGCALQALTYEAQLAHKAEAVRQALVRVGGLSPDEAARAERAIVAAPEAWGYRNKASFVVSADVWGGQGSQQQHRKQQQQQIGMTAPGTRATAVPIASCGLQPDGANAVLRAVRRLASEQGLLLVEPAEASPSPGQARARGGGVGKKGRATSPPPPKPRLRRLVVRSASAAAAQQEQRHQGEKTDDPRDHMVVLVTDRGFSRARLRPLAEALLADRALRVVSVVHSEEEDGQEGAGGRGGGNGSGGGNRNGNGNGNGGSRHAPRAPRVLSTTVLAGEPHLTETLRVRLLPPPPPAAAAAASEADAAAAAAAAAAAGREPLDLSFAVSAHSFFQVNSEQAGALYGLVVEAAVGGLVEEDGKDGAGRAPITILDLFCGTGTIGVAIARRLAALPSSSSASSAPSLLVGVDSSASAIADARQNARRNGLAEGQAAFACGDLDRLAAGLEAGLLRGGGTGGGTGGARRQQAAAAGPGLDLPAGASPPRVVVVNPARAGLGPPVIRFLNGAACQAAERVVYVSCNPRTLARDVGRLAPAWRLASYQPVDLMPQTDHVETVAVLVRRR